MAKRIIWAHEAKDQLKSVVAYWNKENNSKTYSEKIRINLRAMVKFVAINPSIGKPSNLPKVLVKVFMKNFLIIYTYDSKEVIILNFWDVRQDPEKNKYLK